MSRYGNLSREELEERLGLAEDVCLMYGWGPSRAGDPRETDREKATFELWSAWSDAVPDSGPRANPHLTDGVVAELAARRDAVRARTLNHDPSSERARR